MLRGDFSGSDSPIYDPLSGNADGTGRTQFQVFPGDPNYSLCNTATNPNCLNIIPAARMDPIAQQIASHIPANNIDRASRNFFSQGPFQSERRQVDTKVDYNVNSKFNLAGTFGLLHFKTSVPTIFGEEAIGRPIGGSSNPGHGHGNIYRTTVMGTYIFSPTFLMDAHFGFAKQVTNSEQPGLGTNIGSDVLGIPGTNGTRLFESGWPTFTFEGDNGDFATVGVNENFMPYYRHDPQSQYVVNFNLMKKAHNIRFGADFYRMGLNHAQAEFITGGFGAQGGFEFGRGITERCEVVDPASGNCQRTSAGSRSNSAAAFVLGQASSAGRTLQVPDEYSVRADPFSFYIRDRWTIGDNLTLDYGTRWEYFPLPTRPDRGIERYDVTTNKVLLCGIGDIPTDCGIKASKTLFAPRVGMAYRIGDTIGRPRGLRPDQRSVLWDRDRSGELPDPDAAQPRIAQRPDAGRDAGRGDSRDYRARSGQRHHRHPEQLCVGRLPEGAEPRVHPVVEFHGPAGAAVEVHGPDRVRGHALDTAARAQRHQCRPGHRRRRGRSAPGATVRPDGVHRVPAARRNGAVQLDAGAAASAVRRRPQPERELHPGEGQERQREQLVHAERSGAGVLEPQLRAHQHRSHPQRGHHQLVGTPLRPRPAVAEGRRRAFVYRGRVAGEQHDQHDERSTLHRVRRRHVAEPAGQQPDRGPGEARRQARWGRQRNAVLRSLVVCRGERSAVRQHRLQHPARAWRVQLGLRAHARVCHHLRRQAAVPHGGVQLHEHAAPRDPRQQRRRRRGLHDDHRACRTSRGKASTSGSSGWVSASSSRQAAGHGFTDDRKDLDGGGPERASGSCRPLGSDRRRVIALTSAGPSR